MASSKFRDSLGKRILVSDGSMGTLLYRKGANVNSCFEELNLINPDLVKEVHKEYLDAGVDILQTNTMHANRLKLNRYGISSKLREINIAGVSIAKQVSPSNVYIAASVGPVSSTISDIRGVDLSNMQDIFKEQLMALLDGHPDIVLFETFMEISELKLAIETLRLIDKDIPVIAQMSFNEENLDILSVFVTKFVETVSPLGIDVIGANCSVGPSHMLDVVRMILSRTDIPVIAQPNAGIPKTTDGRLIYLTTPDYMLTYGKRYIKAGVSIVGGCCGVDSSHIKMLKKASLALSPSRIEISEDIFKKVDSEGEKETLREEKSKLSRKLFKGEWVDSVEVLSPKGGDYKKTINNVKALYDNGIEFVNIPDGPRAMARMNPLSMGIILKRDLGIDPIIHYTCRDKNLLGIQSDILGAEALGIRDFLVVTGDPPKLGNYPSATAVYDLDSIGLVKLIKGLNRGLDLVGMKIKGKTRIHIGVGVNPGAINVEEELIRFAEKVKAGAEFCMTQPIYEDEILLKFLKRIEGFKIPLLIGICPLTSYKMAEFLHNEVPGMSVPLKIRDMLSRNESNAREIGISISRDTLNNCRDFVQGSYLMAPSFDPEMVLKVLRR